MSSTSALNSLLASSSSSSGSSLDLSSLLTAATGATSSGIDVTSAVDAAIYAAQAPERQWQAEQATLQSQITALTGLQTAAASLSSDLQKLADPLGALAARAVSTSNSQVVTATAASGTATGTHTVTVSKLATAASWYSPLVASSSASLGSSSLTITPQNGTPTTFSLGSTGNASMSALVQSINAAQLGVTASVVQDAAGVRLALAGSTTGSQGAFTVADGSGSASTWQSAEVATASTALPTGSFQISDGSSTAKILVQSGDTLSDVADRVNASGLNLSAQVVTDKNGSYLSVTTTTGQQVTASSDPTLQMVQAGSAQDASLTVDGVPVTSSSNTVTGALAGMTLTLSGLTGAGSATSLGVAADADQITSAVSQFVSDYNSAITLVSTQFTFSASNTSQGVLGSDSVVRSLQSALLAGMGYSTTGSGTLQSLAGLGISMQDDGTLKLDSAAFSQAVASGSSNLQNFFQGAGANGFANIVGAQLTAFSKANTGALASDISNLTQRYNDLQSDVSNFETSYVAPQKTLLTAMYSKAEIALQSLPNTLKQIQAELNNNSGS